MKSNILIIEPYNSGSHAAWAGGYQSYSSHNVDILGMEGRYWKWRMHGGAVTLAKRFMEGDLKPDLIFASDMLDLSTFLALTRSRTAGIPAALYFHENQLSYPWSPDDRDVLNKRDSHYGFINYSSALAADKLFFNSAYHMESFFDEVWRLLKNFPDYNELDTVKDMRNKSCVLHLGLDLKRLDEHRPERIKKGKKPLLLWNHRWEYDKNPADFFEAIYILAEKGLDFKLAVLGENFRKKPVEFKEAKNRLGDRIVQFGYAEDFASYAALLWEADIMPVTSNQDFFGGSVVEGIYCNNFPLLPKRLAYPEHIPEEFQEEFFYDDFEDMVSRLEQAIINIDETRAGDVSHFVEAYRWEEMAPHYDDMLSTLVS
ncbi:MAG: DUF3524 domain-containing protein [bacterium]|nr:DUF3524 domain-containing protein [bacterium]